MNQSKTIVRLVIAAIVSFAAQAVSAAKTTIDGVVYHCNTENMKASVQGFADDNGKSKLVIPDKITYKNKSYKVTSVANEAFRGYPGLKTVVIGNNVETIGTDAFTSSGVKNLTLSTRLKIIGAAAFGGTSVVDVELPASLEIIRAKAFFNCGSLQSVRFSGSKLTEIGEQAFAWCRALTSFSMPASVKTLGKEAFDDCTVLKSVDISPSLTVIPDLAFNLCPLEYIHIPPSVTQIGEAAFCGHATSTLIIPGTVKTIGDSAFELGQGIYLVLNEGIVNIGYRAFASSKIVAVKMPASAVNVGESVFSECYSLKQAELSPSLTVIPRKMFWDTDLSSITIPDGVTHIGESAFYNNMKLWRIDFPPSLRVIGDKAFQYSGSLENFVLNEGLQKIGARAFGDCKTHELDIPSSVTEIGELAFMGFSYLHSVTAKNPVPPVITEDSFSSWTYEDARLVVPNGSEDAYASAPGWRRFKTIGDTSGIDGAQLEDVDEVETRYFDVNGMEIANPVTGEVYIRVHDGKAEKILLK